MAKKSRGRSDLRSINRKLQTYIDFLDKTLYGFELHNVSLNKEHLREAFQKKYKGGTNANRFTYLTDFVEDFIKKAPNLINRSTNRNYSARRIAEYKRVNNMLIEFEAYRGKKMRIDDVNIAIYDEITHYLKANRGYSVNTVGNLVKNLKVFLKKAEELKYNVHQDYKRREFSALKEESISIALN